MPRLQALHCALSRLHLWARTPRRLGWVFFDGTKTPCFFGFSGIVLPIAVIIACVYIYIYTNMSCFWKSSGFKIDLTSDIPGMIRDLRILNWSRQWNPNVNCNRVCCKLTTISHVDFHHRGSQNQELQYSRNVRGSWPIWGMWPWQISWLFHHSGL